jgi:hypothetical protein
VRIRIRQASQPRFGGSDEEDADMLGREDSAVLEVDKQDVEVTVSIT